MKSLFTFFTLVLKQKDVEECGLDPLLLRKISYRNMHYFFRFVRPGIVAYYLKIFQKTTKKFQMNVLVPPISEKIHLNLFTSDNPPSPAGLHPRSVSNRRPPDLA